MASIGLSVPPGLTISTEACEEYQHSGKKLPQGLWEEILEGLGIVEKDMGAFLGNPSKPLLLSVRSGAAVCFRGSFHAKTPTSICLLCTLSLHITSFLTWLFHLRFSPVNIQTMMLCTSTFKWLIKVSASVSDFDAGHDGYSPKPWTKWWGCCWFGCKKWWAFCIWLVQKVPRHVWKCCECPTLRNLKETSFSI